MSADGVLKFAKGLARLGWAGVCLQTILAVTPILMLCYVLFGRATGVRETFDFLDYLAFASLAILVFTGFWSFRYTRLAKRIGDPAQRPSRGFVMKNLWVGVWATSLGIAVSLSLLIIEVVRLLVLFLRAPQAGVPVFNTQAGNRTEWVSAIDAVSLLAELCSVTGELIVLAFSLWLLFRLTNLGDEYDQSLSAAKR
jgi:hypothetical protein